MNKDHFLYPGDGGNFVSSADAAADRLRKEMERDKQRKQTNMMYSQVVDPTTPLTEGLKFAVRSMGGDDSYVEPVTNMMSLASGAKGLRSAPRAIKGMMGVKSAPKTGFAKSAAVAAKERMPHMYQNPAQQQNKQVTPQQKTLLRSLLRRLKGQDKMATKNIQPMMY